MELQPPRLRQPKFSIEDLVDHCLSDPCMKQEPIELGHNETRPEPGELLSLIDELNLRVVVLENKLAGLIRAVGMHI